MNKTDEIKRALSIVNELAVERMKLARKLDKIYDITVFGEIFEFDWESDECKSDMFKTINGLSQKLYDIQKLSEEKQDE